MIGMCVVAIPAGLERHNHAVLTASPEMRALDAVSEEFLEQPGMGHDREPDLTEIAGRVRERAQLLEPVAARPAPEFVDDHDADATAASGFIDGERSDFGNVGTEPGEFGASDDLPATNRHDEPRRAELELPERSGQQMTLFLIGRNERVQDRGFRRVSRTQRHPALHDATPTAPSAASRRVSASVASASAMTSGGNRRTTVSAVRLTITPRSRPAPTTGAASRVRSRPHISPAPRTSLTIRCVAAMARSFCSNNSPIRLMCAMSPRSVSSSRTHNAARHARRLPPYVVP